MPLQFWFQGFILQNQFIEGVEYSALESQIHSYSAQIAGLAFSSGLLIFGITAEHINLKIANWAERYIN